MWVLRTACLAAPLVLALGGCSGDKDDPQATDSDPDSTETEETSTALGFEDQTSPLCSAEIVGIAPVGATVRFVDTGAEIVVEPNADGTFAVHLLEAGVDPTELCAPTSAPCDVPVVLEVDGGALSATLTLTSDDLVERYVDDDADGFGAAAVLACAHQPGLSDAGGDCDDGNALAAPDKDEVCDETDNDCDGDVDEDVQSTFYADSDGDGFGDGASPVQACSAPADHVDNDQDCDDGSDTVNPEASEVCGADGLPNGVDEDCDTLVDNEDDSLTDAPVFYVDVDEDGFYTAEGRSYCGVPAVPYTTDEPELADCDDTNAEFLPIDEDGDGYTRCPLDPADPTSGDCDDDLDDGLSSHPGREEIVANDRDEDCNGFLACYLDEDSDSFGVDVVVADAIPTSEQCMDDGNGFARRTGDCNDLDPYVYPYSSEVVGDPIDQNCDGFVDCYLDEDGDDWGTTIESDALEAANGVALVTCEDAIGFAPVNGDCNDEAGSGESVFPGAAEIPIDGIDQDCDRHDSCYLDGDGDGYGVPVVVDNVWFLHDVNEDCVTSGYSDRTDDCDDTAFEVNPGAPELAGDDVDQNCDDSWLCEVDEDGDGYAAPDAVVADQACSAAGFEDVPQPGDCDDSQPEIFPGNLVPCDGVANGCGEHDVDELVVLAGASVVGVDATEQLQTALSAAVSGDIIELCPGQVYAGRFSVDEPVTVLGNGAVLDGGYIDPDPDTCVEAAVLTVPVLVPVDEDVWLQDLDITGGCGGSFTSGGLQIAGPHAVVHAENLRVYGNASRVEGGGVRVSSGAALEWTSGELFGNVTGSGGGGLRSEEGTTITLGDGITPFPIHGNTGSNGAALSLGGDSLVQLADIYGNDGIDAAVYAGNFDDTAVNTFVDCTFTDNTGTTGSGALTGIGSTTIEGCTFEDNTSTGGGGAVAMRYGSFSISDSTFSRNSSSVGGAVQSLGSILHITNSSFLDNTSTAGSGGAIRATGTLIVEDSSFEGNEGHTQGGAIDSQDLTLTNTSFVANTALTTAGAVRAGGVVSVSDSQFEDNVSGRAGGAELYGEVTIDETWFLGNHSDGDAGALMMYGSGTLTSVLFDGNSALGSGGGLHVSGEPMTCTDCTATYNSAESGGFVYIGSDLDLDGLTVTGNTATNGNTAELSFGVLTYTFAPGGDGDGLLNLYQPVLDVYHSMSDGFASCDRLDCYL